MGKRLTWQEICQKYPGQHIGVSEIETDTDGVNIRTGVVTMTHENYTRNDILRKVSETHGTTRSVYVPRKDMLELTVTGYAGV